MTVILALACADGVVLASDSQATESSNTRFDVPKVFQLTDRLIWAASGTVAIIQDIKTTLDGCKAQMEKAANIQIEFRQRLNPVFKRHYAQWVPVPGMSNTPPATSMIACGLDAQDKPWIVEVDYNCVVSDYSDRGFHTIGSGAAMAQMAGALTTHFDLPGKPVQYGQLVAYRSLNAVIRTSAFGVGGAIQMWTVTASGVSAIGDDERRHFDGLIGGWEQMETETLEALLAEQPTSGEPADMPAVVTLTDHEPVTPETSEAP